MLYALFALLLLMPMADQGKALFVDASADLTEEIDQNSTLKEKLEAILNDQRLNGTVTGVSIRKAETGELLFSHEGNTRLHPASNMKLLTSAAALEKLGPDYQFSTEVLTDGQTKGKVLDGNLYLKGKGDPTLLKEDLNQFAADLKGKGITKIKGDLIGDDSWFDDIRLSQDLNWSDEPFYTGAQVSALTISPDDDYDAGTVIIEVMPSDDIDSPAIVRATPENDYITIVNNTEMIAEGGTKDISIEREHGTNNIIIEGEMPLNGTNSKSWSSVWEPSGYALDVFKQSLTEHGISFIGKSTVKAAETPDNARLLTSKKSMPLEELLIPFMKLSNNGHGEILTKEMGRVFKDEGSWDKGLEVIKDAVVDLGVSPKTIQLRDGSGMSHKTYIPANDLTQLLFSAQQRSWYPAFENSLPVAGMTERLVGGTLRSRMTAEPTKGNVIAKTGSLTSVSTLSGYVTSQDGEKLIFSVLINNYLGSSSGIRQIEDAIATTLASHTF
ncbi:D-alanyl-D-alanine carboxypeptidase/D-alanyl-D-alanine endopeptidase [Sediminibacillus albus]|nr:D-alanyl-D-alanine carboxypeptidase/D-alanyl-D-alanine-endopeptidase [Sediminibacillus albus]